MKHTKQAAKSISLTVGLAVVLLFPQIGQGFYNPSTGRWLNRDPLKEKGGLNLSGFAYNNPISHIDSLGRCVTVAGGNPKLDGGLRFTFESAITDITVSANDGNMCKLGCIDIIFSFATGYYDTYPSTLESSAEFKCNGTLTSFVDFGSNGSDKTWKVVCTTCTKPCTTQSSQTTLGMRGMDSNFRWQDVGSVKVNWNYRCNCACDQVGCLSLNISK